MVLTGKNLLRTCLSFLVYVPNLVASMGTGVDRMSEKEASGNVIPGHKANTEINPFSRVCAAPSAPRLIPATPPGKAKHAGWWQREWARPWHYRKDKPRAVVRLVQSHSNCAQAWTPVSWFSIQGSLLHSQDFGNIWAQQNLTSPGQRLNSLLNPHLCWALFCHGAHSFLLFVFSFRQTCCVALIDFELTTFL